MMQSLFILTLLLSLTAFGGTIDFKTPKNVLSLEMGHHNIEKISFQTVIIEGEQAYILVLLSDGVVRRARVLPKQIFNSLTNRFHMILSPTERESLFSVSMCGQFFSLTLGEGSREKKESLCMDKATLRQQHDLGQWWRDVRSTIRL